jgi:hypothetical protein
MLTMRLTLIVNFIYLGHGKYLTQTMDMKSLCDCERENGRWDKNVVIDALESCDLVDKGHLNEKEVKELEW